MQTSFVSQATQAARNVGAHIATGASSVAQTTSYWGSRFVEVISTYTSHIATFFRSCIQSIATFFGSCSQSAATFCSTQPYVAAGLGVAVISAAAFFAFSRRTSP